MVVDIKRNVDQEQYKIGIIIYNIEHTNEFYTIVMEKLCKGINSRI